ncbi:hypothetical protein CWI75_05170 [Kineobactrum sediminis]|uniref:Uncharacterized protein n=1 Tax=Kineobactrum sediminis TaxID=1905677 RepID=A0A2N5Y5R3_9GAMM|nr:hypothetical protein [Kineobactrum sediminis]PLW83736.1 hypothetical protein CWI75_05170 [Kineobactrum sediminis]
MSNTSQFQQIASNLPNLALLFRWFNRGRHLNRTAEPVLWEELERNLDDYRAIFTALGSELRLDGRGFAWFHQDDGSSNTNKATRQLALLFMVIFDTQADAGIPLMKLSTGVSIRPYSPRFLSNIRICWKPRNWICPAWWA